MCVTCCTRRRGVTPNVLMNYSIDATLLSCVHESFDQQPVQTIALCMWPLFREMSRVLCCLDQLPTASDADVFALQAARQQEIQRRQDEQVFSSFRRKCLPAEVRDDCPSEGSPGEFRESVQRALEKHTRATLSAWRNPCNLTGHTKLAIGKIGFPTVHCRYVTPTSQGSYHTSQTGVFVGLSPVCEPQAPCWKTQSVEMASDENCKERLKAGLRLFCLRSKKAICNCSIRNLVVCISND